MALTDAQVYSLVGVVLILVGVMAYNRMAAKRPKPSSARRSGASAASGPFGLLLKFVHHEGSVVGETVAVDGDRLILKQAGAFKAVPLAQAKDEGREVRLTGSIDWTQAAADGQAWRERNTAGADAAVAGQLTRSEDVRAPALEALRRQSPAAPAADTPAGPVVGAVGSAVGGVGAVASARADEEE